mmetsp:Transcript_57146/g.94945  ORF Transcript_57146/g.94945 Transcript_57146/m.94945 type:complete len:261 (-) Transcript_57146:319-1101(-)
MPSIREAESVNGAWNMVFTNGFGVGTVVVSVLTMVLMLIWILSPAGGGLGLRETTVTAGYFNWHVICMSLAFLLFMTPASAAFEVFSVCSRGQNKNIHGSFQTMAVICIAIGYYIIYDCHMILGNNGTATSMHSVAGYFTITLVFCNYLMAFTLYVLKMGGTLRGELKPLHKRLGMVSLVMGYTTMMMGMTEKANSLVGSDLLFAQWIVALVILTSLSMMFTVVKFVDKKPEPHKYTAIPDRDSDGINGNTNDNAVYMNL